MRKSKGPSYQKFRDRHGVWRARAAIPLGEGKRRFVALGLHGTPESRAKFRAILDEWERAQETGEQPTTGLTVADLCARFLVHARQHYRDQDGRKTPEVQSYVDSFRQLLADHGETLARDFGPLALKAVRQTWIAAGITRPTINQRGGRIKRAWKWAVSEQLVPPATYQALASVAGLSAGRTAAVERVPVAPAPPAAVRLAYRHLDRHWRAMVHLQALTGMRPGEVCRLRGDEIDRDGPAGCWVYRPARHKTAWRGHSRDVVLGPRAQRVLRPWLTDGYLFPSRAGSNLPHLAENSYGHAVADACRAASCEAWTPNRLRHSAATAIQREAGLDGARAVLGHNDPKTTLTYAARDMRTAAEVMRRIG